MGIGLITFPSFMNTPVSFGVSEAANVVKDHYRQSVQSLRETATLGLGVNDAIRELNDTYRECSTSDWDGYNAVPVSEWSFGFASSVLDALPLGTPAPSIGAEPDGHITLEWYKSPYRTLSVSVSATGQLHFAALIGASTQYGSEPFYGEIPQPILDLIYKVSMG
ncbi:MAG: hypothetical protein WA700_05890 [Acidobacteriaceae bacterium]